MIQEEDITGYVVVNYPEGGMVQVSVYFGPEERDKAIAFYERVHNSRIEQSHAELLARIRV